MELQLNFERDNKHNKKPFFYNQAVAVSLTAHKERERDFAKENHLSALQT